MLYLKRYQSPHTPVSLCYLRLRHLYPARPAYKGEGVREKKKNSGEKQGVVGGVENSRKGGSSPPSTTTHRFFFPTSTLYTLRVFPWSFTLQACYQLHMLRARPEAQFSLVTQGQVQAQGSKYFLFLCLHL